MAPDGVYLDANATAAKVVTKAAAISWPFPADRLLDQLVELADEAGAKTRRNEMAAAVLLAAPREPDALLQLILEWRRAKVHQVVLDVPTAAEIVELPRYSPGRRRAR